MKLFTKTFFVILILVFAVGILDSVVYQKTNLEVINSILTYLMTSLSYPLYLFDRTYPFYTQGSIEFTIGLTLLNTLIQTTVISILLMWLKSEK